ncbi:MAG: hypothetical protein PUF78_03270 [Lachnospiraceae bacterium]|nr:hypothetical protein [Lachnospiraceae bacterium]
MIKEVIRRMKNYVWPLVVLLVVGDFVLTFFFLLVLIFFIGVFGGPAFSWMKVLVASLFCTFCQWIIFLVFGIVSDIDQKKEKGTF